MLDLGCGPGLYAQRLGAPRTSRPRYRLLARFDPATRASKPSAEGLRDRLRARRRARDGLWRAVRSRDVPLRRNQRVPTARRPPRFSNGSFTRALSARRAAYSSRPRRSRRSRLSARGPARAQPLEAGLFSARPHDLLEETFWNAEQATAIHRWYVIDRRDRRSRSLRGYGAGLPATRSTSHSSKAAEVQRRRVSKSEWPLPEEQREQLLAYYDACAS